MPCPVMGNGGSKNAPQTWCNRLRQPIGKRPISLLHHGFLPSASVARLTACYLPGSNATCPTVFTAVRALILLVPIVTIQLVVSIVFVQRFTDVTVQMADNVLPDIRLINSTLRTANGCGRGVCRCRFLPGS